MPGFCLDWFAGPMAQLEYCSPPGPGAPFQLKYTSPLRSTIRPPPQPISLSARLRTITERLDDLVHNFGPQRSPGAGPQQPAPGSIEDTFQYVGVQLQMYGLIPSARGDLRVSEMFLEIGMDEALVGYPWELMHDGVDYFCLRHWIGRFVNSPAGTAPLPREAASPLGKPIDRLSVLLISVPQPSQRASGQTYEELPGARAEAETITKLLVGLPEIDVEVLVQRGATYREVFNRLSQNQYHIIHFTGHASLDEAAPQQSSLVLFDEDLAADEIQALITAKPRPPVLCFINACDSAVADNWSKSYNIYGLARSLLQSGTYLLGSRWKLSDRGAPIFAETFYRSLVQESKALGRAVTEGRLAAKAGAPEDLAWASYVLYGDPRLQFRRAGSQNPY